MNAFRLRFLALLAFAVVLVAGALGGCRGKNDEGFAIYLTKDDGSSPQVELEKEPLIATDDIVSYDSETHGIKLTAAAFERIVGLQVPVIGKPFAVCVGREVIYTGAFWSYISSLSSDGIVIMKPLGQTGETTICIELGYPGASHFDGDDLRADERILESLEKNGKLDR